MSDTLGKIFELYGGDSSCVDFASVSGSGEVNEVGGGISDGQRLCLSISRMDFIVSFTD